MTQGSVNAISHYTVLDSGLNYSDHCAVCFYVSLAAADKRRTTPPHVKTSNVGHDHSVSKYTWNDNKIHNFQIAVACDLCHFYHNFDHFRCSYCCKRGDHKRLLTELFDSFAA